MRPHPDNLYKRLQRAEAGYDDVEKYVVELLRQLLPDEEGQITEKLRRWGYA
ncbi:hypothetical protein TUZN_0088 [Thermoproteus uzoniensis 768-20]|uniref:Uncharacterized protein n=1 Tax=Thermoproteus uzoniensis (strain 768-20) TaxID=999630 RepID=F2L142_THEU7|nr:hypothetical protein [Thermoproteus uzoniensis]AEA11591.1 hypothetical protein TUZN_0088 [Thermoproteus uzoniensis 768-20]